MRWNWKFGRCRGQLVQVKSFSYWLVTQNEGSRTVSLKGFQFGDFKHQNKTYFDSNRKDMIVAIEENEFSAQNSACKSNSWKACTRPSPIINREIKITFETINNCTLSNYSSSTKIIWYLLSGDDIVITIGPTAVALGGCCLGPY